MSMHQFHRNLAWGLLPGQTTYKLIRSWDETNWNESDATYRQRDWVKSSIGYNQEWAYPDNTAIHYQIDLLGWNPGDSAWTWQEHETVVGRGAYGSQRGPIAQDRYEKAQASLAGYMKNLPIPDLSGFALPLQAGTEASTPTSTATILIVGGLAIAAFSTAYWYLLRR